MMFTGIWGLISLEPEFFFPTISLVGVVESSSYGCIHSTPGCSDTAAVQTGWSGR